MKGTKLQSKRKIHSGTSISLDQVRLILCRDQDIQETSKQLLDFRLFRELLSQSSFTAWMIEYSQHVCNLSHSSIIPSSSHHQLPACTYGPHISFHSILPITLASSCFILSSFNTAPSFESSLSGLLFGDGGQHVEVEDWLLIEIEAGELGSISEVEVGD